jgi:hypothetical protein
MNISLFALPASASIYLYCTLTAIDLFLAIRIVLLIRSNQGNQDFINPLSVTEKNDANKANIRSMDSAVFLLTVCRKLFYQKSDASISRQ